MNSMVYNKEKESINFPFLCPFQNLNAKEEILFIDKRRNIPAVFFNVLNPLKSDLVLEVYLFNSFSDAMAFFQLKKHFNFEEALFVITGSSPQLEYFEYINKNYENVKKYYLVYPNSIYGKLADVKAACFIHKIKTVSFFFQNDCIETKINEKSFVVNFKDFSLSRIRKFFKKNLPYKTIKSKSEPSFFDELILHNNQ